MLRASLLLGPVAALVLAAPAMAANQPRFAAPGANGAEPCSSIAPCSLKKAIEAATTDGTEVIVKPGNYTYDSTIVVNRPLNVHGSSGEPRPRITPAAGFMGQALFIGFEATAQTRITRLDVRSAQLAVHVLSPNVVVADVVLTATASYGIGVLFESSGTGVIRDSVARANGPNGQAVVVNDGTVRVRNVTAWGSGADSIGIHTAGLCSAAPGSPSCMASSTNPEVNVLNTIAHGTTADIVVTADPSTDATMTIGHSNFAAKSVSPTASLIDDGTNQPEPPIFQGGFISAFHQRLGSPTIDAGVADALNGDTDFDGDPRTLGGAPDIGADEYVAPTRADPGGGDPGAGDPGTGDPGAEPDGTTPDTTAPSLTDLAIAPVKFKAAGSGASAAAKAKTGATVVFTASEPVAVSFRAERRATGRRSGKECVKPTRRIRKHRRCARYLPLKGGFDRLAAAGPSGFKFSGRIGDRKLKAGRYRLVGMATDAAGNLSTVVRAPFRIIRR